MIEYFKLHRPKSIKANRVFLTKEYYKLVELKAYEAPENTVLNKA